MHRLLVLHGIIYGQRDGSRIFLALAGGLDGLQDVSLDLTRGLAHERILHVVAIALNLLF